MIVASSTVLIGLLMGLRCNVKLLTIATALLVCGHVAIGLLDSHPGSGALAALMGVIALQTGYFASLILLALGVVHGQAAHETGRGRDGLPAAQRIR
jgi:hypothetical protein